MIGSWGLCISPMAYNVILILTRKGAYTSRRTSSSKVTAWARQPGGVGREKGAIFVVTVPASCAGKGYHLHHHKQGEARLLLRNLDYCLICLFAIRGPFFLCLLQTMNKSLAVYDVLKTTSWFFSLNSAFAPGESAAGSHPSMTTAHLPSSLPAGFPGRRKPGGREHSR